MKTATERAAQLWCLPQFSNREMDLEFALAVSTAIEEAQKEGRLAGLEEAKGIVTSTYRGGCDREMAEYLGKKIQTKIDEMGKVKP